MKKRSKHNRPKSLIVDAPPTQAVTFESDSSDASGDSTKLTAPATILNSSPLLPKTPYFYRSREALLDLQIPDPDKPEDYLKFNYDGLFNLCVVLLVGACTILCVDNLFNKGLLVSLDLLKCMSGDVQRSYSCFIIISGYAGFMYSLAQVYMRLVYNGTLKNSEGKEVKQTNRLPSSLRTGLYYLGNMAYVIVMLSTFYAIIDRIFVRRLSLCKFNLRPTNHIVTSFAVSLTLMVVMMKMHSYFVYVARNFAPGTRNVPDDEHVTHATIVSTKEFLYFLVAPTMCFFRFYPRTDRIRVSYLLRQAAQMTFCFSVMYIMCMQYLDPVFKQTATLDSDLKIAYLTLKISLPWFMIWLLGSYAFFHCWLNIVAELTTFADRLWYKDWWNADSFGSFWKLWNLPTHQWLLRYVYFQTIRYHLSKPVAVWATFFFSAIIHELCMGIVFRTIRYYFFLAMVVQVPFVLLSEKFKAKNPRLGNALMWLSLFTGQPLMLLMYFKVWYATEQALCSPDLYAL